MKSVRHNILTAGENVAPLRLCVVIKTPQVANESQSQGDAPTTITTSLLQVLMLASSLLASITSQKQRVYLELCNEGLEDPIQY